ncbi:GRAS family protein TF80-like [Lotus japonicus]|uniref:GRAS family protein TF80-like n=1 Tax=Lotus japonicus TaxID=34305 RepID=UPI002584B4D1|nr:GRAS family protein TF80-like [Lotus japonicus]
MEDKGLKLVHLLKDTAVFTESCNFIDADIGLYYISQFATPEGDSMQRVATYFSEALACCQVSKNLRGVPKVLSLSTKLSTPEEQLVRNFFFELYPFLKIAYKTTNQAIIEAMGQEKFINILDLSACDATQWIYLMKSLKEHLPDPPDVKIKVTCIHEKYEVLEQMGLHLRLEAERLNFDFKFNAVPLVMKWSEP